MTAQAGDTTSSKPQLRRELRARRNTIAPAERRRAALQAAARMARLPAFRKARRVAVYLEHRSELATDPLLQLCWDHDKQVYVPRVRDGQAMDFVRLRPGSPLRRDRHGIRTPALPSARIGVRQLDLIVVPLLGFDRQGHRLGSGAGYYDRALAAAGRAPRPLRAGYAYAIQRVDGLAVDPWDIALDIVVTERETWHCRP